MRSRQRTGLLGVIDVPCRNPARGLAPHLSRLDDGRGVNLGHIARIRVHAEIVSATIWPGHWTGPGARAHRGALRPLPLSGAGVLARRAERAFGSVWRDAQRPLGKFLAFWLG